MAKCFGGQVTRLVEGCKPRGVGSLVCCGETPVHELGAPDTMRIRPTAKAVCVYDCFVSPIANRSLRRYVSLLGLIWPYEY